MQIILLEKVINVGDLGDVVKVKQGYARNYLIPQGKAKRATAENIKMLEAKRAELETGGGRAAHRRAGTGFEARGLARAGVAEGRRRRAAVRLRHQLRHRRGAEGAGHHDREGGDPDAGRPVEARRRISARRRALPRRDGEHHRRRDRRGGSRAARPVRSAAVRCEGVGDGPFFIHPGGRISIRHPACHARRSANRQPQAPAAFAGGRAVGAGRPPARQRGGGQGRRRADGCRFLQRCAPPRLCAHRQARRRRQAGGRRDGLGVARVGAEARLHRRPRVSRRAGAERADRGEHPPLRADRARPFDPAPARGDGRRHRGFRVQPARSQREGDPRPGRGQDTAHRGAGRPRRAAVRGDRQAARGRRRADRNAVQPRRSVGRHRRADGIRGPRREDFRAAAGRPRDHRGAPVDGQDRPGAQHRRARRAATRSCRSRYSRWKWALRSSRCG